MPAADPSTEETISPHPHLSWQAVAGADSYRVQISPSAAFDFLLVDDTVHSVIRWFVVAKPLATGRYHWRIRAERDDGSAGPWSPTRPLAVIEPAKNFEVTPLTSLDELRRIAREAAAGPSARIRLAKGAYRWDPGHQQAVFAWKGARNLIVEGNGATITLADPSSQLFHLDDCHSIVIRDLQTSHEPTPYSALEVLAVDPGGEWFEGRVLAGFSEERYPREVNQFFVYAVAPDDFMKKHPDRPGHTYLAWNRTRRIAPGVFRFHTREVAERGAMKQLQPGDRALACYRRWPLNLMSGCRDVAWSGVLGGISEGALFMGGDNSDIKFLGLIQKSPAPYFPSAPGWVTGNDRRSPWIEGCEWEGMTDDRPNITGNSYLIDRNRFQSIASCAIYLENEPTCWEGIVNRNVVIEDNFFTGCGYDAHSRHLQRGNIHVNTWRPGIGLDETDWIGNRSILIRRNTIENWSGIAIGVDNADEVTVRDNVIRLPSPLAAEPVRIFERGTRVKQ